jgi:hypothetical protein
MLKHYDWQGNEISLEQWAKLFGDERHIGDTDVGNVRISTVWLGIDYRFPPLIFETMIFGGDLNEYQERYATEQEARAGHERAVELVKINQSIHEA